MTVTGLLATYADSRRAFLRAAGRAGAAVESYPHPEPGREGEEMAIDVATLGRRDAEAVLWVVSGTHGVEGFTGSALQRRWLDAVADGVGDLPAAAPRGLRVVLIHALNPHGFSWVRRVNEDDVDLNRNFVDWSAGPPVNERYGGIAHLLVPEVWDEATRQATTEQLLVTAGEVGMDVFQEIVSGGQYGHPTGIFYGGVGPTWSHRWFDEHVDTLAGSATRLGIVDLHTGLGPWGHGELISHERVGTPGYDRGTAWWGEVRSMSDGESVSANLSGDWLGWIGDRLPDVEITAAALEFGTVDVVTVLQALRADAWLHAHGDPTDADVAPDVRDQVRAAFADDDPAWFERVAARFDEVAGRAIAALAAA